MASNALIGAFRGASRGLPGIADVLLKLSAYKQQQERQAQQDRYAGESRGLSLAQMGTLPGEQFALLEPNLPAPPGARRLGAVAGREAYAVPVPTTPSMPRISMPTQLGGTVSGTSADLANLPPDVLASMGGWGKPAPATQPKYQFDTKSGQYWDTTNPAGGVQRLAGFQPPAETPKAPTYSEELARNRAREQEVMAFAKAKIRSLPVPAGMDRTDPKLVTQMAAYLAKEYGIDQQEAFGIASQAAQDVKVESVRAGASGGILDRYPQTATPAPPTKSAADRARELKATGMSNADIARTLQAEGYAK